MLCYSPLPIGAPLTMMPPGQDGADDEDAAAQELAVQMFQHVLGIMGAREYPYPDALPDTIVWTINNTIKISLQQSKHICKRV